MTSYRDDDDSSRMDGLQRVGYDADTQTYTWASPSGQLYQGSEGNRHGPVAPIGYAPPEDQMTVAGRDNDKRYMYPFFGLVMVFLLLFIMQPWTYWSSGKLVCGDGAVSKSIMAGDTCYSIADGAGVSVGELKKINEGLDCTRLSVGTKICIPIGGRTV